jgi:sugar lactone lactonase YvrE
MKKKLMPVKSHFIKFVLIATCFTYFLTGTGWSEPYRLVTQWGSKGAGNGQFDKPEGIAVDYWGNVYIADLGNNRILKFDTNGTYLFQWKTRITYDPDDPGYNLPTAPFGLTFNRTGTLYVKVWWTLIQEFDSNLNFMNQWARDDDSLNVIGGVVVDSLGNIYLVDSERNTIHKISSNGTYLTHWGSYGSDNGQFIYPYGIAIDLFDYIYVADSLNHRIQKFDWNGNYITQFGSFGGGEGQFEGPLGVAVDKSGYIYVADTGNKRIQKFDSIGNFMTQWNSRSPWGVTVDSLGNVYTYDGETSLIQKFEPCSYTITPNSLSFNSTGGVGTFTIMSGGCFSWNANSDESWISIKTGSSGSGNGTVTYFVSANPGATRTGNITIAGQTFTITQTDTIFGDISSPDWYYKYVTAIYNQHITTGCSQNPLSYCPSNNVTRGQMAAFIVRSLYGETFAYTQTPYFADVPTTNGFFKYVQKLRDVGITTVIGTYGVDDNVTRGQMAAFIIRAKYGETFPYTSTPYYSDVPADNIYFKYIQKLRDVGITTTTGTYMINDIVTRDQMAAFLARGFLGRD